MASSRHPLAVTGPAPLSRRLWGVLEPYHGVVYFAPEAGERYAALGLKGFWMGYFASRAHPLGPASPELVAALFFNFNPAMVRRALPDAWQRTTPEAVAAARLEAVADALRRLLGDTIDGPEVEEAAAVAESAVAECPLEGRPLFGAYAALPRPQEPYLRLWHASTLLREHRGDGHVAATLASGVGGLEALVLMAATSRVPREALQPHRGWSDDDWASARHRLAERGWLDGDRLTEAGRRARARIEDVTDDLAAEPWRRVGRGSAVRLHETLLRLSDRIVRSGGIPIPNPMGVPWPPP